MCSHWLAFAMAEKCGKGDSAADSADCADSAEDAERPAHANSPARHGSDDDTPSTQTGPAQFLNEFTIRRQPSNEPP